MLSKVKEQELIKFRNESLKEINEGKYTIQTQEEFNKWLDSL